MTARHATAVEPEEVLQDLLRLDPDLNLERYWGERAIFLNPRGVAPLGTIFAAIKDHDGPNDRSAALSRADVYRVAFGITPGTFLRLFGQIPARPVRGGVVELPCYDPTRINELMPHPVYGWMSWVQVLAPTAAQLEALRPLIAESLELVRRKWKRRRAT